MLHQKLREREAAIKKHQEMLEAYFTYLQMQLQNQANSNSANVSHMAIN